MIEEIKAYKERAETQIDLDHFNAILDLIKRGWDIVATSEFCTGVRHGREEELPAQPFSVMVKPNEKLRVLGMLVLYKTHVILKLDVHETEHFMMLMGTTIRIAFPRILDSLLSEAIEQQIMSQMLNNPNSPQA